MCGIAGVVYPDARRPVDTACLRRMAEALRHRGPDDSGSWIGAGIGLAHRRLAVIDLSPAGRQPITNEDGSVRLVFNGEIYNFRELRHELEQRGHAFRSRTDTEVIVHLYEEDGIDCVRRLQGMFAFALWDARERRLVLARDRVGKKPLKYATLDGGLVFASELKAILASGRVRAESDPEAVDRFLSLGYVPAPGTGLRGIRKLPPAHVMVWADGEIALHRYWSLDFRKKQKRSIEAWQEAVRGAVRDAVTRRLESDVPLGALLSGGIDSSIVVACMAQASGRPVETFSVGFDFEAYDELPWARLVAERYATSHHEIRVRADATELLPALARLYEEPYADSSALPSYLLSRETRRAVTVALNGDGGDEGFAGYQRYARLLSWRSRLRGLRALRLGGLLKHGAAALPARWARRLDATRHLGAADLGAGYGWQIRLLSDREKRRLYRPETTPAPLASPDRLIAPLISCPAAGDADLDRLLFTDTLSYLPDDLLVKMDLASMAHGLEARSPLLDAEVLELAASIPAEIKLRGGTLKWLLKEAFRGELPARLLDRPKQGFAIPIHDWFRGPLRSLLHDTLLQRGARIHACLRPEAIASLVEEHETRGEARGHVLWALVMLELWHREVIEAAAPPTTGPGS